MTTELPADVDEHVAHVFGQGEDRPAFYEDRRARDLFEPFSVDCRGLGAHRPTEVTQLLQGRPRKLRFLTVEQLRSVGDDGLETLDRSQRRREGRLRRENAVSRHLYSQVAAGRGTEYGFRRGPDLAAAVGYADEDLAAVPPATLDRFVGLGNPWALGRAQPGGRCVDVGCGVGVDVFVAAGQVGPTGRVIGVDLAPGMVRAVTETAATAGLTHVHAVEASATELPIVDGWADLVTANGLLVVVREVDRALAEIARVLRPGGVLRFADTAFGREESVEGIGDLRYWNRLSHGRPFAHETVAQLVGAGFTDVRVGPPVDPFDPAIDHSDVWGRSFEATRPR